MFGLSDDDELSVLDPVVPCPDHVLEMLMDMNSAVFVEVLIEQIKNGLTERQLNLLQTILFQSNS